MLFDFYCINKMFSGVGYRKVMRIRTDPKHWSTGTGYLFILYFSSKNCLAGFCSSVQKGQYNQYIAQILINPPRYKASKVVTIVENLPKIVCDFM